MVSAGRPVGKADGGRERGQGDTAQKRARAL